MKHSYSSTPKPSDPWDGILLVDKPTGYTSHDVVAKIRRTFNIKKVGHGGTLDPMATGLLVILLGRGTKLSDRLMSSDKAYEGQMKFGIETNTQDADGEIVAEHDAAGVTREQVADLMSGMVGDMMQTPPMVSAIKKNGVPLYKLARKGETVERKPRLIHIYSFSLESFEAPFASFSVRCTKGTYVRTLCADIGTSLGCGAHLTALRRTASGSLHIDDAITLEKLLKGTREDLIQRVISVAAFTARGAHSS